MSCSEPSRHDALIERIMVGDLDPSAPEVESLQNECPDCKERLSQLASVVDLLDDAGREQRATLVQARGATSKPGAHRVEATIREFADKAGRRRFPRGLVLALAAAAAVAALLLMLDRRSAPPPGYHLGTDVLTDLVPQGSVRDYDVFSWTFTLPQKVFFDVVIYDDTAAGKGRKVLEKKALAAPTWQPDASELATLPAAIRWEVRAHDGSGGLWTASARCSSPAH